MTSVGGAELDAGAVTAASGPRARFATLAHALAAPVDIAWLAAFRVLFGLTMCVSMLRFIAYAWIDSFFVRPSFHFTYFGFGWVAPLPGPLMHGLFWVLAGLALCVALGLCFRLSALMFVVGFSYLQLIDVTTYLNHYYLASLLGLLLLVSPAARAYSLDARLGVSPRAARVPGLFLYLFRFQVAVVYTFAGLAKAHPDWLVHAQPLRIWLNARTDMPVLGPLFAWEHTALAMSWAGFLFDTSIAFLLMVRRIRPLAYAAVVAFHVVTRLLFPIGMFPFIMILSALVFFSPEWPRKLLRALGLARRDRPEDEAAAMPGRSARLALALYCAVQVLVPLRFLAYGGNVLWHEQGMRLSWRVMVREKNGSVTFFVRSKQTGRVSEVAPERYLTRVQAREMAGQPDLIWQLAQHIARDYAARGLGPVEVRADAVVSLNGRRGARLIDPRVDLTSVSDGLARATWVMPAPSDDPPHVRPST